MKTIDFDKCNGLDKIEELSSGKSPEMKVNMIVILQKNSIPVYVKIDSKGNFDDIYFGTIMKIGISEGDNFGLKVGEKVSFSRFNISAVSEQLP